jgi:hypothetical protein
VVAGGPPPLRPFGLVLHHDGRWTHEGVPVLNRRLREAFDRSVRYLPPGEAGPGAEAAEGPGAPRTGSEPGGVFVVQIGRFRGWIDVEEAAFFVRDVDVATGSIHLSDGSSEVLDATTLHVSPLDGAGLCLVKRALAPHGLLARFTHAAWSELVGAIEGAEDAPRLRLGGRSVPLPARVLAALA